MFPLLNQLMQLQDLILILEEQKATGHTQHLESLRESIGEMTRKLPKDLRMTFEKLRNRDRNIVVPISADSGCGACSIKLPRSLVQSVRTGREVIACPNCARILYVYENGIRNTRRKPARFETVKPGIARFSAQGLMIPRLTGTDADAVIEEMAAAMAAEGFVDRGDRLAEAAMRREALLSTAVDHGLAFPHARGIEGGGLTLAVGLQPDGVMFDDHREEPVRIVFFMAIPTVASAFYLKLLAGLTETFMSAAARTALLAAQDEATLWKTLIKLTRKTVK